MSGVNLLLAVALLYTGYNICIALLLSLDAATIDFVWRGEFSRGGSHAAGRIGDGGVSTSQSLVVKHTTSASTSTQYGFRDLFCRLWHWPRWALLHPQIPPAHTPSKTEDAYRRAADQVKDVGDARAVGVKNALQLRSRDHVSEFCSASHQNCFDIGVWGVCGNGISQAVAEGRLRDGEEDGSA